MNRATSLSEMTPTGSPEASTTGRPVNVLNMGSTARRVSVGDTACNVVLQKLLTGEKGSTSSVSLTSRGLSCPMGPAGLGVLARHKVCSTTR